MLCTKKLALAELAELVAGVQKRMAKIYCDLIRLSLRTIEQVPLTWREQVQNMLES